MDNNVGITLPSFEIMLASAFKLFFKPCIAKDLNDSFDELSIKLINFAPVTFCKGKLTMFAKLELEKSIVPSLSRVTAPSFIFSIRTRYVLSAVVSV